MSKKGQAILSVLLVYGLALLCLTAFCAMSSCSLLMPCPVDREAQRAADDWEGFRADGKIDETEMRALDSDFNWMLAALDEKSKMPPLPPTGIPWLDAALGVGGLLLTAAGTHKYTMKKRDKTRAEVLKAKTA